MKMTVERYDKIFGEWVLRDSATKQITEQRYELMFSPIVKDYMERIYTGTETTVETEAIKQTIATSKDLEFREIRTFYKI